MLLSATAIANHTTSVPGMTTASIQGGTTGAVKGIVKDAKSGEVIAKAKISMVSTRTDTLRYELQTDEKGYYYKGGLQPGYYNFRVEMEGYLPASKTIRVRLGDTVQSDFELEVFESAPVDEAAKVANKGMKLFREAKWEQAAKEFSSAIANDPSNPLLYFYRGLSQENNGQVEEALVDYKKSIELKPDFILPYSRSGKIYARQQNQEKAEEFYKKAVELGDEDLTTLYNYGVVLINLGRSQDAQPIFERLLELDSDYTDAYYHLGIIAIGQGDSAKAKELLEKFLELDPENRNAPVAKQILANLD
jgi:tetratricopeptide (TPR) repeat protein